MAGLRCLAGVLVACAFAAAADFFPLKDLRPGMRGTGRTVFSGSQIEEFQVEILGILENVGPKQSMILARFSGGPLETTGVLQGMSGSPVYIGGRLVGAVSMAFPFSKEPIAAIRPIEEVLRVGKGGSERPLRARVSLRDVDLTRPFRRVEDVLAGGARMVDIATPVSFGGFTSDAIERFAPQLRALGLEPRQGIAGGGRPGPRLGDPGTLEPGAMITVQLLAGDLSIGADGTVTYIDGRHVYAFGHRFLAIGRTELPFARAEVLTVLPNLATSFKISAPREWMGTITEDRSTAVAGELGQRASMVPVSISVTRHPGGDSAAGQASYQLEMVNDRFLAPFLLQMAVFSAIDATERTLGSSTLAVRGEIEFRDGTTPLRLSNMYSGEFSLPQQVSLATAVPLAFALQSADTLELKNVRLAIESYDERKQMQIDQVWVSTGEARPGDRVKLTVVLVATNGEESAHQVDYDIPVGAPAGPLFLTVADGNTTNLTEYRQFLATMPKKSPSQLVAFLNSLRDNTKAYVRVWRSEPSFDVQGEDFPSPPPSLAQILARTHAALGGPPILRNSKIAEMEISAGQAVISGSKTVQVEIKE